MSRFERFSWLGATRFWLNFHRPALNDAGFVQVSSDVYRWRDSNDSVNISRQFFQKTLQNQAKFNQRELFFSEKLMNSLYIQTGIDPIAFAMRMLVGEKPSQILWGELEDNSKKIHEIDRVFTTDLIRGFIQSRPWHPQLLEGQTPEVWPVQSAGIYYPEYYRDSQRPNDLTELYFAYREGNPEAFSEVVERMRPKIERWRNSLENPENSVVIPMIGTAPNQALAEALGHPTLFPWLPRPENYGQGVEGKRAWVKWQMVDQALQLDPTFASRITGKSVLILDDNLTDGVTYVMARKRLLEAGAQKIALAVLTQTVRHPREFEWLPPGSID
ncbi:MAG: phosphoribosyltransferase [Deltaproteobacteria bacterium]|nr:phosphoribosyltransferase [Deltaproteobacteria bacterium]